MEHAFTVGVEEEFQIVDPNTWELRSHVSELLASSATAFGDNIKREMHQSIVEVGTKICETIPELAEEIVRTRRDLADAAERVGLRIAAAGTHPFSNWMDQEIGSTRLNSSHANISYAVFCLKKKKTTRHTISIQQNSYAHRRCPSL